jgi:hypothetical protein
MAAKSFIGLGVIASDILLEPTDAETDGSNSGLFTGAVSAISSS